MRGLTAVYGEECEKPGRIRRSSTPELLRQRKAGLELELTQVNAALDCLDKNPELENALHLISIALG